MRDFVVLWNRFLGWDPQAKCDNNEEYQPERPRSTREALRILRGKYKTPLLFASLGIFGLLGGLGMMIVKPYDLIFQWKCIFGAGGEVFELWKSPPVDLYLRVFLWNVTNKEEFLSGKDDKLKVEEVGPYVYKEMLMHDHVVFNDNATLTTTPRHPLIWVPELSEGRREDDLLILPNIALLSIAHVVSDESYFTRVALNLLIRQTKTEPLVQMTAREFMFGYKSTLMTLGNKFLPSWIYFDALGLIDRMYDFDGDYMTIFTGEDDVRKAGLIDKYRGEEKIPQWDMPCGNIHGASDGTKFPGLIEPDDELIFFRKSMCRSKKLRRVGTANRAGLDAYLYHFQNDSDDNGWIHEENKCFCKNKKKCLPPGLLDVNGCYYGFPIALSHPHFLDGDPSLTSKIEGVNPDKDKHLPYFIIEPQSGLPLDLAARYQINMALGSIKTVAHVDKFNNMVLPLLWGEIRLYSLPDFLSARFRVYLKVLPSLEKTLTYGFFFLALVSVSFAIYKFIKSKNLKSYRGVWMEDDFVSNIDRKLSSFVPDHHKREHMNAKELEVYFDSLVTPLNQELNSSYDPEFEDDNLIRIGEV